MRRSYLVRYLLICLLGIGATLCAPAEELEPDVVLQSVAPSMAVIYDAADESTGVVLDADGLVLTGLHGLLAPLSRTALLTIEKDGHRVQATLPVAELVSVHTRYNAAYIRVQLPADTHSIPIGRRRAAEVGDTCFVVGPGSHRVRSPLRCDLAGGVTKLDVTVNGRPYLVASGDMRRSGAHGPVFDAAGNLLGIASRQPDGKGMANTIIAISALSARAMVAPDARDPDPEFAGICSGLATELRESLRQATPEDQAMVRANIAYCDQLSIAAAPLASDVWLTNGRNFLARRMYEAARGYLTCANTATPGRSDVLRDLATACFMSSDREAAETYRLAGLEAGDPAAAAAECAVTWATMTRGKRDFRTTAYLLAWAKHLSPDTFTAVHKSILSQAVRTMPDREAESLVAKKEGFSGDDMLAFVKGDIADQPAPKHKPTVIATSDIADRTVVADASAVGDKTPPLVAMDAGRARIRDWLDTAPPMPKGGLLIAPPAPVLEIVPAYYGACLLMRFEDLPLIGIYNIVRADFDAFIPVKTDDYLLATGGDTMLIFYPQQRIFETWDLAECKRTAAKRSPIDGDIHGIAMGLENSQYALVTYKEAIPNRSVHRLAFMDIGDWRTEIIPTNMSQAVSTRHTNTYQMAANADMTAVVASGSGGGEQYLLTRLPGGMHRWFIRPSQWTSVLGGALENRSYNIHDVKNIQGDTIRPRESSVKGVLPVYGSDLVIDVMKTPASLVLSDFHGTSRRSYPHTSHFGMAQYVPKKQKLRGDQSVFASAPIDRVVFVDNRTQSIRVDSLGLGTLYRQLRLPHSADAGRAWAQPLSLPAATGVTIEDGPPGLIWDSERQALTWTPPSDTAAGVQRVLISVQPTDAPEHYLSLWLLVR